MILVISPTNVYFAKRLERECRIQSHQTGFDIKCRIMDIQKLVDSKFKVDISKYESLYIRYPYLHGSPKYIPNLIKLAKQFKEAGKRVFDANIVKGNIAEGKWVDYLALKKAKVSIPKTALLTKKTIPKSWPFILKWVYGFKGKQVFLVNNQAKFDLTYNKFPKGELLVQDLVKADYEYKVITVGYKSLPVVLRFKILEGGFRVNFDKYEVLPITKIPKVVNLAQKASKVLGRELAKVDILESKGKLYVLEVNRFPGLDSFEKLTKYNAVKDFLSYLGTGN